MIAEAGRDELRVDAGTADDDDVDVFRPIGDADVRGVPHRFEPARAAVVQSAHRSRREAIERNARA